MWKLAGETIESRLLLGTSRFPSPDTLREAVLAAQVNVVTLSLRRQSPTDRGGERFWEILKALPVRLLPNTAGCFTVREAVSTAHLARELFKTTWIKLEVIADDFTLRPETTGLVEATKILIAEGFTVFPYMTEEVKVADALINAGCSILMPWAAPIGSGRGLEAREGLKALRATFPEATIIVDAGLGAPSHAAEAMEMGLDGALLNTAVAISRNPVEMARAFALAIQSGRLAYESGLMPKRSFAVPSTPVVGRPFWHGDGKV